MSTCQGVTQCFNQSINHYGLVYGAVNSKSVTTMIQRPRVAMAITKDASKKRCRFSQRKNWDWDHASVTADGNYSSRWGRWRGGGRRWVAYNLVNAEGGRVDAGRCAEEGKIAAGEPGVVELCTSWRQVYSQHVRWLATNTGIWVVAGMDSGMVHCTAP